MSLSNGNGNGGIFLKPGFILTLGIAIVGVATYVAATDYRSQGTREQLDRHESRPAHDNANRDIATLKANYNHIQREIAEIKEILRDLDRKIDKIPTGN